MTSPPSPPNRRRRLVSLTSPSSFQPTALVQSMSDFMPAPDFALVSRIRAYCEANGRSLMDIAIVTIVGRFPNPPDAIGRASVQLFDDDFGITICGRWIPTELADRALHPEAEWQQRFSKLLREGMFEIMQCKDIIALNRFDRDYLLEHYDAADEREFVVLSERGRCVRDEIFDRVLIVPNYDSAWLSDFS